jgi:hypothetical protein
MFVQSQPLGMRGKGFQGESYFATPNPPVGAVIRYYLKEDIKTIKEKRQAAEKELDKAGKARVLPQYDSLTFGRSTGRTAFAVYHRRCTGQYVVAK